MPDTKIDYTPCDWELFDRAAHPALHSDITEHVPIEHFPYEIRVPRPPWAFGATGLLVAETPEDPPEALRRAQYVLRACANHYKLLEALKKIQAGHWEAQVWNRFDSSYNRQWGQFTDRAEAQKAADAERDTQNDTASMADAIYVTDLEGRELLEVARAAIAAAESEVQS